MISLFIINIYFFILFKAKIKADEIGNIQPSDYALFIYYTQLYNINRLNKEFMIIQNVKNFYSTNWKCSREDN